MADLLSAAQPAGNPNRKLFLIGLALAIALAAGFALFYRHENHAPLDASVTRVLTLPLHSTYGHVADNPAADQTEDDLYVVTVLRVQNRSDIPIFLKDIAGTVTLADGRDNPARLIQGSERSRLQQLVPALKPLLAQTGEPPLTPEDTVPPNTTRNGYAIFLYTMPPAEWDRRRAATVQLDFYHQSAITLAVPR